MWDNVWPWLLLTALVAAMLSPLLVRDPYAHLWCKGEHDWVNEGWFSSCSKCPAEYNHYDRPGGAGWG